MAIQSTSCGQICMVLKKMTACTLAFQEITFTVSLRSICFDCGVNEDLGLADTQWAHCGLRKPPGIIIWSRNEFIWSTVFRLYFSNLIVILNLVWRVTGASSILWWSYIFDTFQATYLSTGHIPLLKLFICVSAVLQRHRWPDEAKFG